MTRLLKPYLWPLNLRSKINNTAIIIKLIVFLKTILLLWVLIWEIYFILTLMENLKPHSRAHLNKSNFLLTVLFLTLKDFLLPARTVPFIFSKIMLLNTEILTRNLIKNCNPIKKNSDILLTLSCSLIKKKT